MPGAVRDATTTSMPASGAPIVDVSADTATGGYWLAASDGEVFGFNAGRFLGSAAALALASPHRGHGRHRRRRRLLARGGRRRRVRLRRRPLRRVDGSRAPDPAGGGHGGRPRHRRLLAGGLRRRGVRLRCALRRLGRRAGPAARRPWWGWRRRRATTATSWSPPTVACSPTARRASPGPWGLCVSRGRWRAWPSTPPPAATGSAWAPTAACSPSRRPYEGVDRRHRAVDRAVVGMAATPRRRRVLPGRRRRRALLCAGRRPLPGLGDRGAAGGADGGHRPRTRRRQRVRSGVHRPAHRRWGLHRALRHGGYRGRRRLHRARLQLRRGAAGPGPPPGRGGHAWCSPAAPTPVSGRA